MRAIGIDGDKSGQPANMAGVRAIHWEPGRLWSWWELMERFRAASYGAAVSSLMRALGVVTGANFAGLRDEAADQKVIRDQIEDARQTVEELPLSFTVREQFERLRKRADDGASSDELMIMLREYWNNLLTDMSRPWFLVIRDDRREFYEQSRPPFGSAVADHFPEARPDIAAASRCFALDEWTACVFHAMRVLEHGLRAIAVEVGLPSEAMAHENWKNVIDQVERKIRDMEGLPKSPEKAERLRVLSGLATEFRYFKDAWRNHVSHSRAVYAEIDATTVYGHVRYFMNLLAAGK